MDRPIPSTAASSRPFTSSGLRPTTAGRTADIHHGQQQYYNDYGDFEYDEEEEESDDEDVFAYLPPSTAEEQEEQQRQQLQMQQQQLHANQQPAPNHGYSSEKLPASSVFANSPPTPPLAYPSPTFDPYARYPADSSLPTPGPSMTRQFILQPPPQSPPSTESNKNATPDDEYRLRRIHTAADTIVSNLPTTADSKEVRVALPPAVMTPSEKEFDIEEGSSRLRRRGQSTHLTDSSSIDHSIADDSSYEGSVK
jgi:hypothetical protein